MDADGAPSDHGFSEIRSLASFLKEFDWLIEAHGARFFTRDFARRIPKDWWDALLQLSETQLYLLPCLLADSFNNTGISVPESLIRYLDTCKFFRLPSQPTPDALSLLSTPLSISTTNATNTITPIAQSPFARLFTRSMSPKKSHEVELLADLIYRVSLAHGCRSILDLGCGQGYLMHVLSFYYKLDVLGVDSSGLQTKGAQRKAEATQVLLRTWTKKDRTFNPAELDFTPVFMTLVCPIDTNITMARLSSLASDEVASSSSATVLPSDTSSASSSFSSPIVQTSSSSNASTEPAESPSDATTSSKPKKYPKKQRWEPFRKPETHPLLSEDGVILVGLHTCGDLAPTTLRLFHESPTVKAMINVGCCYNLMTELQPCQDHNSPSKDEASSTFVPPPVDDVVSKHRAPVPVLSSSHLGGYPLSSACKEFMPKLSRTARVLACQSIAKRPAHAKKEESDSQPGAPSEPKAKEEDAELTQSIHMVHRAQVFRAVLQVIYERDYENQSNNYSGEYSSDYLESFSKYAMHLLKKQGKEVKLTVDELETMWTEIGVANYKRLVVFDNLRVCLSSVIESLVMKDRLLFLYEQNKRTGVHSQHALFPIFDAAISPRNMALLSTKL